MRYRNIIIALGLLVIVVRFLGFPSSWDAAIYSALGLLVIAFAYVGEKK
ncbi:hypothetical protein KW799_00180 [Candidatus Parcubacteria bacterium]|nr:hypothetical protein [Candidatus Parcubacteria bacterium]